MKMKLFTLRGLVAAAIVQLTLLAGSAHGAFINWGAGAQNITGDSNVSTAGSLVGAFNVGAVGVPPTTVNSVPFQPFALTSVPTQILGNFELATGLAFNPSNSSFGSGSAPFTSMSPSYQALLQSGASVVGAGSFDFFLRMTNLTPGDQYQFQWWSNNSTGTGIQVTVAGDTFGINGVGGNAVALTNNTGAGGGLGQYAIGTFLANATSQDIYFQSPVLSSSGNNDLLNAFQLRDVTAIPEPGTLVAGLLVVGVAAFSRFPRRH